jgi:hypothetical protein
LTTGHARVGKAGHTTLTAVPNGSQSHMAMGMLCMAVTLTVSLTQKLCEYRQIFCASERGITAVCLYVSPRRISRSSLF